MVLRGVRGAESAARRRHATARAMGARHGIEILPAICPDIGYSTASDIASFAIGR